MGNATTCLEAIAEGVEALGGNARAVEVRRWVEIKYPGRWTPNTIQVQASAYFNRTETPSGAEDTAEGSDLGAAFSGGAFSLESDMEDFLVEHLATLEPGLKLALNGRQVRTPAGIIDLLAVDADSKLVVIELKAGKAQPSVIAQALSYLAWASQQSGLETSAGIRAIVVAHDFDTRVSLAASVLPNVMLKRYQVAFTFIDDAPGSLQSEGTSAGA